MKTQKLLANQKDVGGIPIARLLPQGSRRTVGPWCFLDHAGPSVFEENNPGMQVGAHPHTNLQTFTWMLEGEVWHQDSLGYRQLIRPGQVNLMTAGTGDERGISHTEQTPEGVDRLHAVQLWIALPMNKQIEPAFEHYPELPTWTEDGIAHVLTTGSFGGHTAPTTQHSPMVAVDMRWERDKTVTLPAETGWEYGVLVIAGRVTVGGESVGPDELGVIELDGADRFELQAEAGTHLMLVGGERLPHPTLIWWNFVADTPEALSKAVEDWNSGSDRFGPDIDLSGTKLTRLEAPPVPGRLR